MVLELLKEEEYYMSIVMLGMEDPLRLVHGPLDTNRVKLTGVPFTAEHQERIKALEKERGEISMKLSAAHEERERAFMGKAAAALGLNMQQVEQVKPDLFRLVKDVSDLRGADISKNAESETKANLLFTVLGGFIGAFLAEDAAKKGTRRAITISKRNSDAFEGVLMEHLNLNGEEGRAQARQKIESFLAKELNPEAAASYKALSTVKVFDPMYRLKTWLTSVFGGKEKLISFAENVKAEVDKAVPDILASVMTGDKAKTRMAIEASGKRLAGKYGNVMAKVTDAAKAQLSKPLGEIINGSLPVAAPVLKSLPKAA